MTARLALKASKVFANESTSFTLYLIINTLISVSNITINGLLTLSIYRLGKLKTLTFKFIICLNIADIGIGITQPMVEIINVLDNTGSLRKARIVALFVTYSLCQFSVTMVVIVAVDRHIRMKHLMKYNSIMTKKLAIILVTANCVTSLSLPAGLILASIYGFYALFHITIIIAGNISIIVVIVLYTKTYFSIREKSNNLQLASEVQRNRTHRSSDKMFAKGMLFVLLSLVFCYIPFYSFSLARSVLMYNDIGENPTISKCFQWSCLLVYANSSLNAIFIIVFNKQIKQRIVADLPCRKTRVMSLEESRSNFDISEAFQRLSVAPTTVSLQQFSSIKHATCR